MDRRDFLFYGSMAATAMLLNPFLVAQKTWKSDPFSLGIASGEPDESSVVLWTRLAPHPTEPSGGIGNEFIPVEWEIARDEGMRNIVQRGTTYAGPNFAHSVHVEVQGLSPDSWYWYRFHSGNATSQVGRTRTVPLRNSMPEKLRFSFICCQKYENGYYTAFDHLGNESPDLIVHLGDYIYEKGGKNKAENVASRLPDKETCVTLDQYRLRYALYKSDPLLQKVHRIAPWIVTLDDHEVSNDWAGDHDDFAGESSMPPSAFLLRRAAAFQAYYEHLPLRRSSIPRGPSMHLYRTIHYGQLAAFYVLDTRQYRSEQPCGDRVKPVCPGALRPAQTMMGPTQEEWLYRSFSKSTARWNVLAQQTLMSDVNFNPAGHPALENMDKWSGYHAARNRLYKNIVDRKLRNPVVLSGDFHRNFANDLKVGPPDGKGPVIASEFLGTSITSNGDGCDLSAEARKWLAYNPQIRFFNEQRGYVTCDVTAKSWKSDFRVLDFISRPGGSISTRASLIVEDGRPGPQFA